MTGTDSSPSSLSPSVPVKPFYLSRTIIESILNLPAQIFFALAGMIGLAHYARGIVCVSPINPGMVLVKREGRADGKTKLMTDLENIPNGDGNDHEDQIEDQDEDGTENGIDQESEHGLGEGRISLNRWIEENVPSLKGGFTPSWWLPNGHLQTFYIVLGDFSKIDQIKYERTYLRLPDNGTISLDFAPVNHESLPPTAPTVVVNHGLTGGSHESYIRNLLSWVIKPVSKGGLGGRGVVVNFRGCAGTPVTSCQFYSAGTTIDLHSALHFIRHRYPCSPLHGAGFSLGASVLSRYLGETGQHSFLTSGLVLGCPWDLLAMSDRLETGWLRSRVYSNALAENLLKLFIHHDKANKDLFRSEKSRMKDWIPEIERLEKRRKSWWGKTVRLREVDNVMVTKIGGPEGEGTWPFDTAEDYYKWASPNKLVKNIKVPVLAINAFDDPVVAGDALPIAEFQSSSYVYAAITGAGGHLGWFDGPFFGKKSKSRWVLGPMSEFLLAATKLCPPYKHENEEEQGYGFGSVHGNQVQIAEVGEDGFEWVVGGNQDGYGDIQIGWRVLKQGEIVKGEQGEGTLQGL